MPPVVSQEHLNRLSITRSLLQQAEYQLKLAGPLRCIALLSLHDSVEMFLDTAADANHVPPGRREFVDYWRNFVAATPSIPLPMERAMAKINRARVALKHHGIRPGDDQLRDYLNTVMNFLDDACPICFSFSLDEASMLNLVQDDRTRDFLKMAESELSDGKLHDALASVAKAFHCGSSAAWRRTHYEFSEFFDLGRFPSDPTARVIKKIVRDSNRSITLVSLGINLLDYEAFRSMLPPVYETASGNLVVQFTQPASSNRNDARWCIDFVIDFMLRSETAKAQARLPQA